jgi:hypothetical protein
MPLKKNHYKILFPLLFLLSCKQQNNLNDADKIFTRLTAEETGIHFSNDLQESEQFSVFVYRNYYNGAGIAIGDINNDGLPDIYFSANSTKKKLYLNQGNFHFKDITASAGVGGKRGWSNGVSMVDINADGLLDIYVCNSGDVKGDDRKNELFINNGDLTFTEKAKEYGLDDEGFTTQAAFFDYDKDGDLDCYILNDSFIPNFTSWYINIRSKRDSLGGDKFLRNDNGVFHDVSEQAGIYGSAIGFGLGVTIGDVNHDNWPDIYIANDFFERDYLYINNQNGTFTESLESCVGHCSKFSMGGEMADVNNDGYLDIFSTDMLPENDYRLKTMSAFDTYDIHKMKVKKGYYYQYMRNMLQLNNQDGTFSEIGQLAGVSATDWSWGALVADFNNDGNKEIFVCTGIYRDMTDQDFLEFVGNEENLKALQEKRSLDYQEVIKKIPSTKLSNYMFTADGEFHYKNVSAAWGLDEPSYSAGSAYGDLDNDGDLDLVINNVNQEAFVYRNETTTKEKANHFLSINFKGYDKNTFGLGAKVEIFKGADILMQENMPIRGYQSSMDYKMIMGVGKLSKIDSMKISWPDGKIQTLTNVSVNSPIILDHKNAVEKETQHVPITSAMLSEVDSKIDFTHTENGFNDFNTQRNITQMLSTEGPALAVADLNNDKLDDFFIGGASMQSGKIFIQNATGKFTPLAVSALANDSIYEDVDAVFFDADNDHDLDLYVVSGSSEFAPLSQQQQDRLYINNGSTAKPSFERSLQALPDLRQNGSCVRVNDYDLDGDQDIFLGTRLGSHYGAPCDAYLLENDGKGTFKDVSAKSPILKQLGMVTDAVWFDFNGDDYSDLFVVGEWMPLTVLVNDGKQIHKAELPELDSTTGWWSSITTSDIDHDGDADIVVGNHGLNARYKASKENPVSLYVSDFDKNGTTEQIFTYRKDKVDYPIPMKQELSKQMSFINKKFIYNKDYAGKSISEVFGEDMLKDATIQNAYEFRSGVLINHNKHFHFKPLPIHAQFGPVMTIELIDLNDDKKDEIILGGNMFAIKTDYGRYDALYGLVLEGNGKGDFKSLSSKQSGVLVKGETRSLKKIKGNKSNYLLFARNNDTAVLLKINAK